MKPSTVQKFLWSVVGGALAEPLVFMPFKFLPFLVISVQHLFALIVGLSVILTEN